ncbi:MAG TPA: sigma-70 family RNA polymerase sigma factor [Polyangiales bacterium]|nr:sigma-70 family RNA polymerase sigma factor [Polyangiales bacterium]
MSESRVETEQSMREAFDAGHFETVAHVALATYGQEILNFMTLRLRARDDAQEAFSMFAEDLWRGLPDFGWRCSMRTWAYTLARNAATRYGKAPQQARARNIPLSRPGVLSELIERVRSATHRYQRTRVKDRFRELREKLDPEAQILLVLRVDRGLSWRDLAMTMSGDVDLDDETLERESARLRKAFERVKIELKRMAEDEGLLNSHTGGSSASLPRAGKE